MLSTAEVLSLAQAYADATGVKLSTVAGRALGERNSKAFQRLAQGQGISTLTFERAAMWLLTNWPAGVPWPADVPGGPVATVTPAKSPRREVCNASEPQTAESH